MYISIIAKATPFEDARVKEQGELLEREGKCFLDKTYLCTSPKYQVCIKLGYLSLLIEFFFSSQLDYLSNLTTHTIYTRNNMGHKCEGDCGLWVLNEILKKHILKI